jgi:asparagine synthase (glutamine-hydrolysing)
MLVALSHRGPDDAGVWHDGPVALGFRRLTVLDLSRQAHQPMLTPDGLGVLVYNGEVYNYRDLRRELEAEGLVFRSSGDTEVVLAAIHHWGPERSIPRFNGMFALAYFDRRGSVLWLARDRTGIKPLLVAEEGDTLLFASEVKGLIAHPQMRRRVDMGGLVSWLANPEQHAHQLLFEGVEGVAPGSLWKVTAGGTEKRRYFDILNEVSVERILAARSADADHLLERTDDLIKRSVALHLASDVPLAAMCSGGVDSSLITAIAEEHVPGITGYVADLPFAKGEGDQAERVGRYLGVPIRRIPVDRNMFLRLWPRAVWHSDGPPRHRSDPALLAVTQACRQDGIKVLLTGEGSDELFGGYLGYRHTYRRWRKFDWPRRLLLPKFFLRRTWRELGTAPFGSPAHAERLRAHMPGLQRPAPDAVTRRLLDLLEPVRPAADRALIAHCLADFGGLLSRLLHRHDRMGMASSIEMRVPFLENEIIDFAIHLPAWARLRDDTGKWLVKAAAARRLPVDIVHARKKMFPTPGFFLRGTERLILGGRLAEHLEWPPAATEEILGLLRADNLLCFQLVGLEMWLRIFFHGETTDELGDRLVALAA